MSTATLMSPVEIIDGVTQLFKDQPEVWTQCAMGYCFVGEIEDFQKEKECCLLGAVSMVADIVNEETWNDKAVRRRPMYLTDVIREGDEGKFPNFAAAEAVVHALADNSGVNLGDLGYGEETRDSLSAKEHAVFHFNDKVPSQAPALEEVLVPILDLLERSRTQLAEVA